MAQADYDVAVIGVGPVGAMCANLLGQQGMRVLALEKGDGDPKKLRPRAITLDDSSLRSIQTAGLAEVFAPTVRWKPGIIAQGLPLLSQWVSAGLLRTGEGALLLGPGQGPTKLGPRKAETEADLLPVGQHGWRGGGTFYQPELERVLREGLRRFPNVDVRWRTNVSGYEELGDSAVAVDTYESQAEWKRTAGGEWILAEPKGVPPRGHKRFTTRVVISCEGAGSRARTIINPETKFGFQDLGFHEDWCCLDVMLKNDDIALKLPPYTTQVCDPARPCTFVPGSWVWDNPKKERHARWEFKVLSSDNRDDFANPEFLAKLLKQWGLAEHEYEIERSAVYQFHALIAPKWQKGRLVLAGDACHTTPPFLGQGLNQGLRDATALCWRAIAVARGDAPPSSFGLYENERKEQSHQAINRAVQMGKILNELSYAKEGPEQDAIAQKYRSSGFDKKGAGKTAAAAAAAAVLRQPAGEVQLSNGRRGRLDALIGGYCWCILCRPGVAAGLSADSVKFLNHIGATVLTVQDEVADQCGSSMEGRRVAAIRPDRTACQLSADNVEAAVAAVRQSFSAVASRL